MRFDEYVFHFTWHFAAPPGRVAELILDVSSMPEWLPEACREAVEIEGEGEWRRFHLELRGFLPHTVRLDVRAREALPHIYIESGGNLLGTGEWLLAEEDGGTRVDLAQSVRANTPILRVASFFLRPLCVANHNWIMRKTGEAMARKLVPTEFLPLP